MPIPGILGVTEIDYPYIILFETPLQVECS